MKLRNIQQFYPSYFLEMVSEGVSSKKGLHTNHHITVQLAGCSNIFLQISSELHMHFREFSRLAANHTMEFFSTPETMPVYKQPGWESSQLGDIPFLGLTLAFTTLVFVVELLLDTRQYEKFSVALLKKKIPKELVGIIKQETFDKANDCKLFESTF